MNIQIVIPAHNEEAYIERTLKSLINQTFLPSKIVVVNDHSTDRTFEILTKLQAENDLIQVMNHVSEGQHQPGSKVVKAFYHGLQSIDAEVDIICKFDADLIFPGNYLERLVSIFENDPKCGMAGGYCTIQDQDKWIVENLTGKDHIRGALKAYRKLCFDTIGGLKQSMGWDTLDELLARYHGWSVITVPNLHVKHLKPTGATYTKAARFKQGEAFKKMRYGFWLSALASAKLAFRKKSLSYLMDCMKGYFKCKDPYLVTETEGRFIRSYRWKNIRKKLS